MLRPRVLSVLGATLVGARRRGNPTPPLASASPAAPATEPVARVDRPAPARATEDSSTNQPGSVATGPDGGAQLANRAWVRLVEECVDLFDELDRLGPGLDAGRREMADHVSARLREILERAGVQVIEGESAFVRARHHAAGPPNSAQPGVAIAATLSPGFAVERRILRRARVQLATSVGPAPAAAHGQE